MKLQSFLDEIKELSTDDISLILEDQRDLYTDEEIRLLENEFLNRRVSGKTMTVQKKQIHKQHISNDVCQIVVSSGYTLDGYRIEQYIDVISMERMSGIGLKTSIRSFADIFASLTGDEMTAMTNRINELKQQALLSLKEKAVQIGANALIGIDFETTLPGNSAILVSVSGTAIKVRKI